MKNSFRLLVLRVLSSLFPNYFGAIGAKHFLTPARRHHGQRWRPMFERLERTTVDTGETAFPLWRGGNGPRVLLIHGWEHDHDAMGAFVEPLLAGGFSVAAPDLPAHGQAPGHRAPVPTLAAAVAAAAGDAPLTAVIAHSVGAAATVRALGQGGIAPRALVLIGCPQGAGAQSAAQARAAGLGQRAIRRMHTIIESRLGIPLESLRVDRDLLAASVPTLLVHTRDDPVVSFSAAEHNAAHNPVVKRLTLDTGGHNRPLSDPRVIAAAVDFVTCAEQQDQKVAQQYR